MNAYLKLAIAALCPAVLSVFLYYLDKCPFFSHVHKNIKQVIYGILFGLLAIVGTEWGIPINGAQMNCRDGAVLTAGLLFGAPAGVIAGLIGGVERWVSVAWGVGTFTRVACTVSTILAGVYSALLRKYMFEDKKPGWLLSFAIGVVMEIIHLTMVFITNMATPTEAMAVVRICTVPMVVSNGLSVMLSVAMLTILSGETKRKVQSQVRISQTIQGWLFVTVALAFFATSFFVFRLQSTIADVQTDELLDLALEEIDADIDVLTTEAEEAHTMELLPEWIANIAKNRHIGKTGYILVIDQNKNIISAPAGLTREKLEKEVAAAEIPEMGVTFRMTLNGQLSYSRYQVTENHYIVSVLPEDEALQMRNIALYVNTFLEVLVFAVLFGLVYLLIKRVVVNQIKDVNRSLAKITGGNLDVVVNVRSNEEFASLSDDINATVDTLKKYIAEASARIDQELKFAKDIQSSALPGVFPAFPKRRDFDIYALMNPAKEVGGDFYDFYITKETTLHFLIADVSGKGIPAAMFMMRAKTELKSLTETEMPLSEVFTHGNDALCEGNDAGMFVTVWEGTIDLTSGLVRYANAGHNPPLVRHGNGKFEYLRSKPGFVLAGMEGIRYSMQELQLEAGDMIFLYTDGVTEATNAERELYGEERLRNALNTASFSDMRTLCDFIRADVDAFVGDAPQFDDITMLALYYVGQNTVPFVRVENAELEDLHRVTAFAEAELEKMNCPMKAMMQISTAIDEIFSNIVMYGYPDGKGPVEVSVSAGDVGFAVIRFTDCGIPYDPLAKEDPDISLSIEERPIGGLGIFMVKKMMDEVLYERRNDRNILTLKKRLS